MANQFLNWLAIVANQNLYNKMFPDIYIYILYIDIHSMTIELGPVKG